MRFMLLSIIGDLRNKKLGFYPSSSHAYGLHYDVRSDVCILGLKVK
jgi:hypothetical protein